MKRRTWPSSPRRCWRRAGKRPSISETSSGRLAAELEISRTLLVCFWKAFGNRTLTDITFSGQAEALACFIVFFDELFKVGEARADGLVLAVGALQAVGGLEAVAGDAGDGEIVGLDAAMGVEACRNRGGDAAGGLGEDAFGFGELLDGGDDFYVRNVLGPAAGFADDARGVEAVGGVADGERAGDGVGALRLDDVSVVLDGFGDGGAAGGLRAEEADLLVRDEAERDEFVERLADLGDERAAGHGDDNIVGQAPAELLGDLKADGLRAFGVVRAEVHVDEAPVVALG